MLIFFQIYELAWYAIVTAITLLVVLLVLRTLMNYGTFNPFGSLSSAVRRVTDPLVYPVRGGLVRAGLEPKIAPLITILIAILLGYVALELVWAVMFTLAGVVESLRRGAVVRLIGFVIYGLLAIYSLMIFMRIVFSWGVSSVNRLMRFLIRVTEPVLGPFRRLIPTIGMFDISPIVVLLLIQLFQRAIAGTLLG